jgi:hypothetical protein
MRMNESKYLTFKQMPPKPKTQVWDVLSKKDKSVLGTIKWYAPWRQYCFFPACGVDVKQIELMDLAQARVLLRQIQTVFNVGCMLDIISFMNDLKKVK